MKKMIISSMAFLVVLMVLGCADNKKGTVEGQVTFDGQPVQAGSIMFTPADGAGQTAGALIKDGHYTLVSSVGGMKVAIRAPKVVGKTKVYNTPDSPVVEQTVELAAPRYNTQTELKTDVKPGMNKADFDLKSDPTYKPKGFE